jgi:adenylate cyclase class 2
VIEAELKADVHDPDHVAEQLRKRGAEQVCVYRDTYYERPGDRLDATDAELRVRSIDDGQLVRHVLTFKTAAVHDSGSKPEYETAVANRPAIEQILTGLGFVPDLAFEKHCRNYRFRQDGRDYLATLVTVPEVGDATFIELETMVERDMDVPAAIGAIKGVFAELGIGEQDLNGRFYQEMVLEHRGQSGRHLR